MEDKPPLLKSNPVYTLIPQPILDLVRYIRELRIKRYKQRKIQEAKTAFDRNYHLRFKIHLKDEINSQESSIEYEMVVPAKAAYFAKMNLEEDIKNRIYVEVTNWEEMTEKEYEQYLTSRSRYIRARANG